MTHNNFNKILKLQHGQADNDAKKYDSQIVHGTVISIDPLSIELETGDILPSKMFYPLDAVLTKKVRMIVHRAYGKPREVQFAGTANEVSNSINALLFNLSGGGTSFDLQFASPEGKSGGIVFEWTPAPVEYGIAGDQGFRRWLSMPENTFSLAIPNLSSTKTMDAMHKALNAKGNVVFRLEFIEEEAARPRQDENIQKQTTAIEGIIWQGMRVGDVVQMTSHNHGQKYQISRIINRERAMDDYEQANIWDSRINDVPSSWNMQRKATKLPPKPNL